MERRLDVANVQEEGCGALNNRAAGTDAHADAVVEAGGLAVLVAGMERHLDVANVQEEGCGALNNLAAGTDAHAGPPDKAGGLAVLGLAT